VEQYSPRFLENRITSWCMPIFSKKNWKRNFRSFWSCSLNFRNSRLNGLCFGNLRNSRIFRKLSKKMSEQYFSVSEVLECFVEWKASRNILTVWLRIEFFYMYFGLSSWLISRRINRGYYTVARRYEFYIRVARTLSYKWAQWPSEILFLPREHKIHIFELTCNVLFII